MSLKKLEKKVNELDLERILNIIHFKDIDDWIVIMDKRWKGRVKKRDLVSLYKWIKDIYGKFTMYDEKIETLEKRLEKLENSNSK